MSVVETDEIRSAAAAIYSAASSIKGKYADFTSSVVQVKSAFNSAKSHDGEIVDGGKGQISILGSDAGINFIDSKIRDLASSLDSSVACISTVRNEAERSCDVIDAETKNVEELLDVENSDVQLPDLSNIDWSDPAQVEAAMHIDIPEGVWSDPDACRKIIDYYKKIQDNAGGNTDILQDDETFNTWRKIGVGLANTISFWQLRERDSYTFEAEEKVQKEIDEYNTSAPEVNYNDSESIDNAIDYYEGLIDTTSDKFEEAEEKWQEVINDPKTSPERIRRGRELSQWKNKLQSYQRILDNMKRRKKELD